MPGPTRQGHMAKPKNLGKTFRRLLTYYSGYKFRTALVILSILVYAGAGVAATYVLKPIFNLLARMLESGSTDYTALLQNILLLGGVYLTCVAANLLINMINLSISTGILARIRIEMFDNMQRFPLRYFDARTHGEIMSRYSNDTDTLRELLGNALPQVFSTVLTVLGVFAMMIVLSPILTLVVVVFLVIMLLLVKKIGGRSAAYFKKRQEAMAKANGYIEEHIEGQREVKVFCREKAVNARFAELADGLRHASTSASTFAMILMPLMANLSYVLYAAAAAVGATLAIVGYADIGTLAAFLQYTRSFSQPITQVSQLFNGILNALAGAERIFELIDEPHETDDGKVTLVHADRGSDGVLTETAVPTAIWAWKKPDGSLTELCGDVRFNGVTFSYDGKRDVLSDMTLYAKPGQKIAFVGSTGAGKTTVTNLINRFYDVQEGSITYDGIDVRDIRKDDLRRSLSMVLQDTHLFTGTVRDNIRYGRLEATDAEVEQAAKLANAHFFISHLPQGYETVLTADGANLSQGQRQLIAIARAMVENAPVLILDEATSSIDTRTEAHIERGMDELMAGRTVFVIAHRLSTVRNANAIMVLEDGRIIERGDHADLLAQKGRYYQLYTGMFELT